MGTSKSIVWAMVIVVALAGVGLANWSDSFDGGKVNLTTWKFLSMPQITGTYTQTFETTPEGNPFLVLTDILPKSQGGALFGAGFGSTEEFTDVRVGAVVNVAGNASGNHHGLAARAWYIVDPDGSISGLAPGIIASCYVMHINWQEGPANLRIDVEKVVQLQNIMQTNFDVVVPGLAHERSYYAELDVAGSGPVYVTGSLYEFQGGPLVARTATMVDTAARDSWEEDAGEAVAPFLKGPSGIFAQNEQLRQGDPIGFRVTFDDVFSASDGPAAAAPSPANGATDVSVFADLSWLEAKFATGRQLWFGPKGNMQPIGSVPGNTFSPARMFPDTTYEWRVDEVGPAGTVAGPIWTFTVGDRITIEDFESYADNAQIGAAWVDNIDGYDYVFLETGTISQGAKAMKFTYQNAVEPFITEATRTFAAAQDWTAGRPTCLTIDFHGYIDSGGPDDNFRQPLYVRVVDEAGDKATVTQPFPYAVQSAFWRTWDIPVTEFAGVNLAAVKQMTIGTGSGTSSGQPSGDLDILYIDNIRLSFLTQ